jgi:hypothetical protein
LIDQIVIPIDSKSGFPFHITLNGEPYTASARCECEVDRITLYDAQRADDHDGERTLLIHCAVHGDKVALALRDQAAYHHPAFRWAEERHAKDRRVQWGMSRRCIDERV